MGSLPDNLPQRFREIVLREGRRITEKLRRQHIDAWLRDGTLAIDPDRDTPAEMIAVRPADYATATPRRGPCRFLGEHLRTEACQLCGMKGQPAPVHHCLKHDEERTERTYGLRTAAGRLMETCIRCDDYEPEETMEPSMNQVTWDVSRVAPVRPQTDNRPWEGAATIKPWEYRVQIAIAHLDTPELLEAALPLWRLQTVRPFVCVVDTGSTAENLNRLLALEADDVEVHCVRSRGLRHASSLVSVALDVAAAANLQEYQFHTHTDVFPRRRDLLESLIAQCDAETPVVGYEISPRSHVRGALAHLWRGMVGHTCTMLHAPTIRSHGIVWHIERGFEDLGLAREPSGNTDTEVPFNLQLSKHGLRVKLIGHDENSVRQVTDDIDHFRSFGSSLLYAPNYHAKCREWATAAIADARARIEEWSR